VPVEMDVLGPEDRCCLKCLVLVKKPMPQGAQVLSVQQMLLEMHVERCKLAICGIVFESIFKDGHLAHCCGQIVCGGGVWHEAILQVHVMDPKWHVCWMACERFGDCCGCVEGERGGVRRGQPGRRLFQGHVEGHELHLWHGVSSGAWDEFLVD